MSHDTLLTPISDWLLGEALADTQPVDLFSRLCERLAGIGIPIVRGRLAWRTLHPMVRAEQVQWDRGSAAALAQFLHMEEETASWHQSPLRFAVAHQLSVMRRRLSGPNAQIDFPILQEMRDRGMSEYLVLSTPFRSPHMAPPADPSDERGILVTWATDRPAGFSDDDLKALQQVQRYLAVACKGMVLSRIAENIAVTYLGRRAGHSVLEGHIRKGDGRVVRAVIWYSDLRDSTMLAEQLGGEGYLAHLNSYFAVAAQPVHDAGGEVLDFIGDAVLGVFPYEDEEGLHAAGRQASTAVADAIARTSAENRLREVDGRTRLRFGLGLHVGEVKYGNIGIPQRLSFSVIGQSVNEAARVEQMTKELQQPILSSAPVARLDPPRWRTLGHHKLNGVLEPMELFAYQPDAASLAA